MSTKVHQSSGYLLQVTNKAYAKIGIIPEFLCFAAQSQATPLHHGIEILTLSPTPVLLGEGSHYGCRDARGS